MTCCDRERRVRPEQSARLRLRLVAYLSSPKIELRNTAGELLLDVCAHSRECPRGQGLERGRGRGRRRGRGEGEGEDADTDEAGARVRVPSRSTVLEAWRGHGSRVLARARLHTSPTPSPPGPLPLRFSATAAARLIRHVGYGNAAGYLSQVNGALPIGGAAPAPTTDGGEDSEGEDAPLDAPPELGSASARPGHGMTEEEKEAEAERLLELFDRLARTGVVRVGVSNAAGTATAPH